MTEPLRMDTRPILKTLEKPDNKRADWEIIPFSRGSGWKCVHVQKLSEFDGGGNHNVYIDVLNEDGQRIARPSVLVEFGWGDGPRITYFEKPEWEPGANYMLSAGMDSRCAIKTNFPSDLVVDLLGEHGHTSYYVVFQFQSEATLPSSNTIAEIKRKLQELQLLVNEL